MAATKVKVNGITPFLWFEKDCEKAAAFYVSVFEGSRIVSRNAMGCEFEVAGQRIMALNGGAHYRLTPAFSLFVSVSTQSQVDDLWAKLTADGGREDRCGWLVDRFGVSWQVIPRRLMELLGHKDPKVAKAGFESMMTMRKIDIAALDAAVAGLEPRAKPRRKGRA